MKDRVRGVSRLSLAVLFALLGAVILWPFPYQRSLNNPNENVRVYTTMAIVEKHTFAIDDYFARFGATMDVGAHLDTRDGKIHTYSVKGPGTSYLGVPVYWVFRKLSHPPADGAPIVEHERWLRRTVWVLRIFTEQIPALLFLIFLERFLRRFTHDPVIRLAAVVGVGIGTNYLAYALMYVSHTQIAIAAFGGWALLYLERARDLRGEKVRFWALFLAGLFAGACTSFEYQGVICTGVLSLYACVLCFNRVRSLVRGLPFAAGILLNVAGIAYFQKRCWGSPWTPGHKFSVAAASAAGHAKGLYGIQKPKLDALGSMLVDPAYGLFGTAPLMAIGCIGLAVALRFPGDLELAGKKLRGGMCAAFAMCVAYAIVLSGMEGWRGGWTIGPRYLTVHPPFFALGAVIALELLGRASHVHRAIARALAVGLAAAGVIAMGVISTLYNTLPEDFTRPFSQMALTMIRGGIYPYTIAAWWNDLAPKTFYVVFIGMIGAFVWLLAPRRESGVWFYRVALTLLIGAIASAPAFLQGQDPPSRASKAWMLSGGHFEPATGYDEGTQLAKRIGEREGAHLGGPTQAEALRMCVLMRDQAQDATAADWCARATKLGAQVPPFP